MNMIVLAIVAACGSILLAGVAGWLMGRARTAGIQVMLGERDKEIARLTRDLGERQREIVTLRDELSAVQRNEERVTTLLAKEREMATSQIAQREQMEGKFRDAFAAQSQQALQMNGESFLTLAKATLSEFQQVAKLELEARQQSIDELVKPVRDGLTKVEATLQTVDRQRAESHASLQRHLRLIAEAHQQLAGNTQSLVHALRAPQGRGRWGEMQLRRVVELAGMQEHCDFREQVSIDGDAGRLRPDLIVHLPLRKVIVVDAKAPLSAYLEAIHATDDGVRGVLLDKHARQVRDHVEALAAKDYASEIPEAPDFVFMFLPGEDFFAVACQRDPSLLEFAMARCVFPASPTTLISMLKAAAYGWQQERIAEKAEEIRDLGQTLYERMSVLAGHLVKMRKGLDAAVGAYNGAIGSIESRVLPVARRFRELGAVAGEEIETVEVVDTVPRVVVAPELLALPEGEGRVGMVV